MTSVNAITDPDPARLHTPLLMGVLYRRLAEAFDAGDWDGLRQSHFRVLASLPADGLSVTALAARLGMTKQGCGQLVSALVDRGHASVGSDAADARVRRVLPTPRGERLYLAVRDWIAEVERAWAAEVGESRYAVFRSVLEELVGPGTQARQR